MKRYPNFSPRGLLFAVAEMFLKVALFLEPSSVLKNSWYMPGRPPRLADKGNFWTFTLSMISYSQISLF